MTFGGTSSERHGATSQNEAAGARRRASCLAAMSRAGVQSVHVASRGCVSRGVSSLAGAS